MFQGNENFRMKWDSYVFHALKSRKQLYNEKLFSDVTLVSDDLVQFQAHKTVLAAASPTFSSLLQINSQAMPLLYLKGVRRAELKALLQFIYLGETSIPVEFIEKFTRTATELGIYEQVYQTDNIKETKVKAEEVKHNKVDIEKHSVQKLDFLSTLNDDLSTPHLKEEESGLSFLNEEEPVEEDIDDDQAHTQAIDLLDSNNSIENELNEDKNVDEDKIKNTEENLYMKKDDEKVSPKKPASKVVRKPEKPGYCNECDKHFTAQRSLKRHIAVVHELAQVVTCDVCKKQFNGKDSIRGHLETHRTTKDFGCQKCDKYFRTKGSLQIHNKSMHPLPSCTFHNIQFKSDEEMEKHLKNEHLNKYC